MKPFNNNFNVKNRVTGVSTDKAATASLPPPKNTSERNMATYEEIIL